MVFQWCLSTYAWQSRSSGAADITEPPLALWMFVCPSVSGVLFLINLRSLAHWTPDFSQIGMGLVTDHYGSQVRICKLHTTFTHLRNSMFRLVKWKYRSSWTGWDAFSIASKFGRTTLSVLIFGVYIIYRSNLAVGCRSGKQTSMQISSCFPSTLS